MIASKSLAARRARTRVDVAAQRDNSEVGAQAQRLEAPARRRGAEPRTARERGERAAGAREQRVARVGALGHRGDAEAGGELGRQIFHRMNCQVDTAIAEGLLQLLDEKPLATDLGERRRGHPVTAGANRDDLDAHERGERRELVPHQLGLREREPAGTRTDTEYGGHLYIFC